MVLATISHCNAWMVRCDHIPLQCLDGTSVHIPLQSLDLVGGMLVSWTQLAGCEAPVGGGDGKFAAAFDSNPICLMHARVLETLASYTCFRAWRVPSFQQTLKCRVGVPKPKMHTIYTSLTLAGAAFSVLGYQPGRCSVYNFHHILVFGPGGWNASSWTWLAAAKHQLVEEMGSLRLLAGAAFRSRPIARPSGGDGCGQNRPPFSS